jgi:hypothetical protein
MLYIGHTQGSTLLLLWDIYTDCRQRVYPILKFGMINDYAFLFSDYLNSYFILAIYKVVL